MSLHAPRFRQRERATCVARLASVRLKSAYTQSPCIPVPLRTGRAVARSCYEGLKQFSRQDKPLLTSACARRLHTELSAAAGLSSCRARRPRTAGHFWAASASVIESQAAGGGRLDRGTLATLIAPLSRSSLLPSFLVRTRKHINMSSPQSSPVPGTTPTPAFTALE
jgi:hypothetical protein